MSKIFFATNRDVKFETSKKGDNFGDRFNTMGPQCFRVGHVDVKLKGDPYSENDDVWRVGRCKLFPEELNSKSKAGAKLGSAAMFDELRKHLKASCRDVILFIHGFANDFPNTARRAAALENLYGAKGDGAMVIAFAWPSNGEVFPTYEYFSDREDAGASGLAMARALERLVEFLQWIRKEDSKAVLEARRQGLVPDPEDLKQCHRKIHLVAHSMGTFALRAAVNKFAEMNAGKVPRVFDHAFLMASDEDEDALGKDAKLGKLLKLCNRVHVYHADDDRALEIADKTKGNPDRLGTDGPDNLDLLSERITAIDCSDVSDTTLTHGRHQYYRLRKEVIEDVVLTLTGAPQDGRDGRIVTRPGRAWRLKDQS